MEVLRTRKDTGPCRRGSPEIHFRKHGCEVTTNCSDPTKLYFDRQPRGGQKHPRWWLFSIRENGETRQRPECVSTIATATAKTLKGAIEVTPNAGSNRRS